MDPRPRRLEPLTEALDPERLAILDYLEHHLAAYPFDPDLDARFVEELLHDFLDLDILEQIKAFRWYYDDVPFAEVKKPRVSLRRWLANARPRGRK